MKIKRQYKFAGYKILEGIPSSSRSLVIFLCVFSISALTILLIMNGSGGSAGESVTASIGSASAIQAAADAVYNSGGGTVYIPAGKFNLDGSVTISNNTKLIGAGTEETILYTSGTSQEIHIKGDNTRLSGFSLISTNYDGGNGIMVSDCIDFRIDHLHIEGYSKQAAIHVTGADTRGVIDHNWIRNQAASSLGYGVVVYKEDVWNEDMQLGTKYAVFIEDNTFVNCRHAVAANSGAHYVFRYNLVTEGVTSSAVDAHGPYWGSDEGTRAFEVYGNTIENPEPSGSEIAIGIRGGGGVIFDNIIREYTYGVMFKIEKGQSGSYPLYHQPHEVYIWDNSFDVLYDVGYSNLHHSGSYIKENRDWFAYPLPGYTPYTYPHPLTKEDELVPNNQFIEVDYKTTV